MRVEVNGTQLWFDVEGAALETDGPTMRERPTVVLLHGGPGSFDHSYLKPDFARLAQVGAGRLPGPARPWPLRVGRPGGMELRALRGRRPPFCDAVGIGRPIVYGHSLGGNVAMTYAARHPAHPGALVLQSTYARFDLNRVVEEFRRAGGDEVAAVVERVYGGDSVSVTPDEWAPCWELFGPRVPGNEERARTLVNRQLNAPGLELMRGFDVTDQLAEIECRTLVSVGELDPITPLAAAREIVDALPEGIGQLQVLEGAGHFPWMDVPDRYWPLLAEFVLAPTGD